MATLGNRVVEVSEVKMFLQAWLLHCQSFRKHEVLSKYRIIAYRVKWLSPCLVIVQRLLHTLVSREHWALRRSPVLLREGVWNNALLGRRAVEFRSIKAATRTLIKSEKAVFDGNLEFCFLTCQSRSVPTCPYCWHLPSLKGSELWGLCFEGGS